MRYVAATLAVLTCPCHLVILLPLLAGTALGAALGAHLRLALIAMSALFLVSAWTAVRLLARSRGARAGS